MRCIVDYSTTIPCPPFLPYLPVTPLPHSTVSTPTLCDWDKIREIGNLTDSIRKWPAIVGFVANPGNKLGDKCGDILKNVPPPVTVSYARTIIPVYLGIEVAQGRLYSSEVGNYINTFITLSSIIPKSASAASWLSINPAGSDSIIEIIRSPSRASPSSITLPNPRHFPSQAYEGIQCQFVICTEIERQTI